MKISLSYFTIIETTAFILGISPLKLCKNKQKNRVFDIHDSSSTTVPKYERSYLGLTFWIFFLADNVYHIYDTYHNIVLYSEYFLGVCFSINFCLTLVEFSVTNLHPLTLAFFVTFYRAERKCDCIARVRQLYNQLPTHSYYPPLLFFAFQTLAAISIFIDVDFVSNNTYRQSLLKGIIEYYRLAVLVSNDFMITMFCYIAARSYEYVNQRLELMILNKNIDQQVLIELEDEHWKIGNLSNDIDLIYGIQLLFFWPFYITRMISWLMFVTDNRTHEVLLSSFAARQYLQIILSVITIIYISYVGTFLTKKAQETNYLVQKLKFVCAKNMNEVTAKIIKIFTLKLNSRTIKLTAGGFLQINMQLVQSFLGLILTYWTVLVQFRNDLKH